MQRIESGLRQLAPLTIGGVALLAFVLFLRALFAAQSQPTAADSPLSTSAYTPLPPSPLAPRPSRTPPSGRDFYDLRRLTGDEFGEYRPAVSPDGRRVAFASERDGNWDIYVLDLASGAEQRLTDDPLNDMAPSWSPDSMRIAYQHNIPDASGPVLVERIVMNADGSGKVTLASGSVWNGNEPPAWSPSGDQIAFTDSRDVVVVSSAEQREVARFTPPEVVAYREPAWFDDQQIVFIADGRLTIGDIASGAVILVEGINDFTRLPMTTPAYPRIGFFELGSDGVRLVSVYPNGAEPYTLSFLQAGLIQHAAWARDGRFIALYADDSVHVAIAWTPQYQGAPLFSIPNVTTGLSDLVAVSWLPDGSGFVFPASFEGQPELYLAMLNEAAIQAYLEIVPTVAPTAPPPATIVPPPTPSATPTPLPPGLMRIAFRPAPGTLLDRSTGFEFGAEISYSAPEQTIAHIVAFQLYPGELPSECMTPQVPIDRQFWAEQKTLDPGPYTYSQRFFYSDLPGADRLVIRASVIQPGVTGQIVYCEQQVYALTPGVGSPAPAQVPPPLPGVDTPTPYPTVTPLPTSSIPAEPLARWMLLTRWPTGMQVAVVGRNVWVAALSGVLYSPDGGGTWSSLTPPGTAIWVLPSPGFAADRTLFAAGPEAVFRSSDAGATWQTLVDDPGAAYTSLAFDGGALIAARSTGCEMRRSMDGGATWTGVPIVAGGCTLGRILAARDGTLYAMTYEHGLRRSRDSGSTWTQLTQDTPIDLAVDPGDPALVYVLDLTQGLSRSEDWGNTWVSSLLPVGASTLEIGPNGSVYAGGVDGRVYRSTDRGTTWREISTFSGSAIRDISVTNDAVYVLTELDLVGGYEAGAPVPAATGMAAFTPTPTP